MTHKPRTWWAVPDWSELCETKESAESYAEGQGEVVQVIEKWAYDDLLRECIRLREALEKIWDHPLDLGTAAHNMALIAEEALQALKVGER